MSMTHRQRSLTTADGRAVHKRRRGSVDVEQKDEHGSLALKHSASGNASASSSAGASGHEEHVNDDVDDDNDSDDNDGDKSEAGSDTDNSGNDDNDEHADDGTGGTANDADGDESGDSNDSSDEDEDEDEDDEEQDLDFCNCGAETMRCQFCSDLFCRDCAIKRRWRKLHPDIDYDSDEHAEALDLAHTCFSCHHQVI